MTLSKNEITIIGAGGHTRSLINTLNHLNYKIEGVYDDSFNPAHKETILSIGVNGKIVDAPESKPKLLSFGDNHKRANYFEELNDQLIKDNIIHPTAIIEDYVVLGDSNQILAGGYLNVAVTLGTNNIINTRAILEHEVKVGDHNHIAVNVIVCGRVSIGNHCFIGAGSVVIDKVNICDNVIIGAHSLVTSDIVEAGTYVGNPVRRIK